MHCHQASILNVLIEAAVADFNFHVNIEDSMSGIQAWNQKKNTENLFPRAANDLSPRLGVGIIIDFYNSFESGSQGPDWIQFWSHYSN